jgi:hypothetical protein
LLTAAGALAAVLVVLTLPAGLRGLQRRRRLADGSAGALWDELTATAKDMGLRVHPSWTPRRTAGELAAVMSRPAGPDATLRLALGEEAASYGAGSAGVDAHLADALRTARRGLLRATRRRRRLRAMLWPASLVAGAGGRLLAGVRRRRVRLPGLHRAAPGPSRTD